MGIGPSTKETSKHYFQDPLIDVFADDPEIDFRGVIVVGTPQDNRMKHLVGQRAAVCSRPWAAPVRLSPPTAGAIRMSISPIRCSRSEIAESVL